MGRGGQRQQQPDGGQPGRGPSDGSPDPAAAATQEHHDDGLGEEVLGEPGRVEDSPVVQGAGAVRGEGEHGEGGEVGDGVERAEAAEEPEEVTGRAAVGRARAPGAGRS